MKNQLVPSGPRRDHQAETDDTDVLQPIEGLTAMQSAFVRAYVMTGDGNAAAAAREAGYAVDNARMQASRMMQHPKVLGAIVTMTQAMVAPSLPVALRTMVQLATGARSEFVRQTAAADLLNRGRVGTPDRLGGKLVSGDITITIDLG